MPYKVMVLCGSSGSSSGQGAFLKDRWSSDNAVENPTSEGQTSVVGLRFGVRESMFKSSEDTLCHESTTSDGLVFLTCKVSFNMLIL